MPISVKNSSFLRSLPNFGQKLVESLQGIVDGHNTVEQQGNFNSTGDPQPPPNIQGINVQAANGHFQVSINHQGPIYRGVRYYVEHASNPNFTDPHIVPMHDSRNANVYLGNVTRYWRGYAAYPQSGPGSPAYHGGSQPIAVTGGGTAGPAFLKSQGSGTGLPGEGLSGPGPVPFRTLSPTPNSNTNSGVPPIRKD